MARATPYTVLALDKYAEIMGINPLHFNSATAQNLNPAMFPLNNACQDLWVQKGWAYGKVGRDDLALQIRNAELELERVLRYPLVPSWVSSREMPYPRYHRREYYDNGKDIRGEYKPVRLPLGRFIAGGQRASTLLGTATKDAELIYSDEDADGFYETATITMTVADDVTDPQEIRVYFSGKSGENAWEVRPLKTVAIAANTLTITIDSWLLINQDLFGYPTTDGFQAVDVSTVANYVTTCEVYRVYNDTTASAATFFWRTSCSSCGGNGCQVCSPTTQTGCLSAANADTGLVAPHPASYDSETGQWNAVSWTTGVAPDRMKLSYYAGYQSQAYLGGALDPLDDQLARAIAYLATARLERPPCDCSNVTAVFEHLREDRAVTITGGRRFTISFAMFNNPFGTRTGEVEAWRIVKQLRENSPSNAAVVA